MSSKREKMPSQRQPPLPQPGRRSRGPFPSTAHKAIDDSITCDTDEDLVLDSQSLRKPKRQRRYTFNQAEVASIRSTPDGETPEIQSDLLLDEKLPPVSRSSRLWLPSIKDKGMNQFKSRPGLLFKPSNNAKPVPEQPRYAPEHETRPVAPNRGAAGGSPSPPSSHQVKPARDMVSSKSGSNAINRTPGSTVTSLAPRTGFWDPYDFPDSEDEDVDFGRPAQNSTPPPRTSLPRHVVPRKPSQSSMTPPPAGLPRPKFATQSQRLRLSHSPPAKTEADLRILSESTSGVTSIPQTQSRVRDPGPASSSQRAPDTASRRPAGTSIQQSLRSPENGVTEIHDSNSHVRPSAKALGKRAHHSVNDNVHIGESGSRTTKKTSPRPLVIKNSRGTFSVRRRANSAPDEERDTVVSHHVRREEDSQPHKENQQHKEKTHVVENPDFEADEVGYRSCSSSVSPNDHPTLVSQFAKTPSSPLRRPRQSHRSESSLEIPQPRSSPNHARARAREDKTPRHTQSSPSSKNRSKLRTYGQKRPASTAVGKEPATIQDLRNSYNQFKQSRELAARKIVDLIPSSQSARPRGRPRKIDSVPSDRSLHNSPSAAISHVKSMMTTRPKKTEVKSQLPQSYFLSGSDLSENEYQPSEQSTCSFDYGMKDNPPRNVKDNRHQDATSARRISSQPRSQSRSKSRSTSMTPFAPVNRLSRKSSFSYSAPRDSSSRLSGGYSKRVRDVFSDASDDPVYGDDDDHILRTPPASLAVPFKLDRTKKPNAADDTDAVNEPETLDDLHDIFQESDSHEPHASSDNVVQRKPWWQPWDWARKYGGIEFETQGPTVWFGNGPFRGYIISGPLEGNYMPGTEAPDDKTLVLAEEIAAQAVEDSDWPTSAAPSIRSTSRASERVVENFEADEDSANHRATGGVPDREAGEAFRKAKDVKDKSDDEEKASLRTSLSPPLSWRTKAKSSPPEIRALPREVRMEMTKQYVLTGSPTARIPPSYTRSKSRNVEGVPESIRSDGQEQTLTQAKRPQSQSMISVVEPALTSRRWASLPPSNQELGALVSSSPPVHSALPPSSPIRHMTRVPFGPRGVALNEDEDDDDEVGNRYGSEPRSELSAFLPSTTPSPKPAADKEALQRFKTPRSSAFNVQNVNTERRVTRSITKSRPAVQKLTTTKRFALDAKPHSPDDTSDAAFLEMSPALHPPPKGSRGRPRNAQEKSQDGSTQVVKPMTGSEPRTTIIVEVPGLKVEERAQYASRPPWYSAKVDRSPKSTGTISADLGVDLPGIHANTSTEPHSRHPFSSKKVVDSEDVDVGPIVESSTRFNNLSQVKSPSRATVVPKISAKASRGGRTEKTPKIKKRSRLADSDSEYSDRVTAPVNDEPVEKLCPAQDCSQKNLVHHGPPTKPRLHEVPSSSQDTDEEGSGSGDDVSPGVSLAIQRLNSSMSRKPSPKDRKVFEEETSSEQEDAACGRPIGILAQTHSSKRGRPQGLISNNTDVQAASSVQAAEDPAGSGGEGQGNEVPGCRKSRVCEFLKHPEPSLRSFESPKFSEAKESARVEKGLPLSRQSATVPLPPFYASYLRSQRGPKLSTTPIINLEAKPSATSLVRGTEESGAPRGNKGQLMKVPEGNRTLEPCSTSTPRYHPASYQDGSRVPRSHEKQERPHNKKIKKRKRERGKEKGKPLASFATDLSRLLKVTLDTDLLVEKMNWKRRKSETVGEAEDQDQAEADEADKADREDEEEEEEEEEVKVRAEKRRRRDKADDRVADGGPRYEASNRNARKSKKRRRRSYGEDVAHGATDETEAYAKKPPNYPRDLGTDLVSFFTANDLGLTSGSGTTMGVMTPPTTSRPSSPESFVNHTLW